MSMTLIEVAPSITWLLVRISPVAVSTMPVPYEVDCSSPSVEITSTSPGSTLDAIWLAVRLLLDVVVAVPDGLVCRVFTSPPAAAPSARAATPVMTSARLWREGRGGGGGGGYIPYGYVP